MEQDLRWYRYYPPSPEEQRSFWFLFLGTLGGFAVCVVAAYAAGDAAARGLMAGAAAAIVFRFWKAAVAMESRGQRARNAGLAVAAHGLCIRDARGQESMVAWESISDAQVKGGKLFLQWPGGTLTFGSREVEDGMQLTRLILNRLKPPERQSTFIPLEPK